MLLVLLLSVGFCHAQSRHCGTMYVDSMRRAAYPELGTLDQFEEWLQGNIIDAQGFAKTEISYTLPVVVHVIHNGQSIGSGMNISDAQIKSQIDVLNEDFRKWNSGVTSLTQPPFNQTNWSTIAADCEINFCLAKYDPAGNVLSSPGIDRVNRNTKGFPVPPYDYDQIIDQIKPATIWDPNKYLNIWVLDFSIDIIGFSTFPIGSTLPGISGNGGTSATDGVVIQYNCFGRVGNVSYPYNRGKTTVHEIGHWLGLRHIWGDAECATDYCNDTPTQSGPNDAGCPTFPHITCSNGPNGDMFVNYMDYSDDACLCMFTNNQKTRMHTVMANSPFRAALATQSANCGPSGFDEHIGDQKIEIYPNPSDGMVYILIPVGLKVNAIEVLDILSEKGYEVSESNFSSDIQIDLINRENSIFFVKIVADNLLIIKKIIINK